MTSSNPYLQPSAIINNPVQNNYNNNVQTTPSAPNSPSGRKQRPQKQLRFAPSPQSSKSDIRQSRSVGHPSDINSGDEGEQSTELNNTNSPLLPLFGEILTGVSLSILCFSILLSLRLEHVSWMQNYWIMCIPLWIMLLSLLLLTQTRKLTHNAPLPVRMSWLVTVVGMISFLVLLGLNIDGKRKLSYQTIFFPLWAVSITLFWLAVIALFLAYKSTKQEYQPIKLPLQQNTDTHSRNTRRQTLLSTGFGVLCTLCVFVPFLLLLQSKLTVVTSHSMLTWPVVFCPLWIVDGFFLCMSCCLCVFTIGANGFFTITQVITFLLSLFSAVAFKVLLVIKLQHSLSAQYYIVFIPLYIQQLLLMLFGIQVRLRKIETF